MPHMRLAIGRLTLVVFAAIGGCPMSAAAQGAATPATPVKPRTPAPTRPAGTTPTRPAGENASQAHAREIRELFDIRNDSLDEGRQGALWFKNPKDGGYYVAGLDKAGVFHIERLDVEGMRADIDGSGVLQEHRTDQDYYARRDKSIALIATLADKYPAFKFLHENYPYTFQELRIVTFAERAYSLDDLRRNAAETRVALHAARTAPADAVMLNTAHFHYATIAQDLFLGNFGRRYDDYRSFLVVEQYIVQFSNRCRASLPKDNVEIVRLWTEDLVVKNGYGGEISRTRVNEKEIHTGIYTTPALARTYGKQTPQGLLSMLAMIGRSGMMQGPQTLIATAHAISEDMGRALRRHGCDSPATRRLGDNLLNFMEGRDPATRYSEARHLQLLSTTVGATGVPAGLVPEATADYWRLDYGSVPESFVPTVPTNQPRPSATMMAKTATGMLSSASIGDFDYILDSKASVIAEYVALRKAAVAGWRPGTPHAALDAIADPALRPMLEDMAVLATDADYKGVSGPDGFRHHVLLCNYVGGEVKPLQMDYRTGSYLPQAPVEPAHNVRFWFKTRPSFATREYLQQRSPTHPLLSLRAPRESCPTTGREAIAIDADAIPATAPETTAAMTSGATSAPVSTSRGRAPAGRLGAAASSSDRPATATSEAPVAPVASTADPVSSSSSDGAMPGRRPPTYAAANSNMANASIARIGYLLEAYSQAVADRDLEALEETRGELTPEETALVAPGTTTRVRFDAVDVQLTAPDAATVRASRVVTRDSNQETADDVTMQLTRRATGWVIVAMAPAMPGR